MSKLEEIMDLVLVDAEERREDAGMGGEHGDRGASRLEDQVKFYTLGYNQKFPEEWKKYEKQYLRETDPEYETYLKLKNKFEG